MIFLYCVMRDIKFVCSIRNLINGVIGKYNFIGKFYVFYMFYYLIFVVIRIEREKEKIVKFLYSINNIKKII